MAMMIGGLARRTGTKVTTIRFYEERGLMPRAMRTDGGRRTYGEADVQRLSFIRHGRELGFPVEEIRSLIELSADPDRNCASAAEIARSHLADIELRIERLSSLRDELQRATTECGGGRMADCRILDAITGLGRD